MNITGEQSRTERVLADIADERARQRTLEVNGQPIDEFDQQNSRNDWVSYIVAYAGRAADKVARNERQGEEFRKNMVKAAAIAVAAIEQYDKGNI